ncbi:hypothetical protein [Halosegnis marinus]|uniref:Uncharacterized protein n=1 Tax=Halosegnis marinus TaxID=3034023 RepID=A0ABD5ZP61_9EURY|nr:hypothetical protein [Halosegnis sp. DT85]
MDRLAAALAGCTAVSVGYTLVYNDRARDTYPGVLLVAAAADYYGLAVE